jgi:hypothetical protein
MKRRAFLASLAALVGAAAKWLAPHKVPPPRLGHLQLHAEFPPAGVVDDRMLWHLTREQGRFGIPGEPKEVVAWGRPSGERSCWPPGLRSRGRTGCPGAPP